VINLFFHKNQAKFPLIFFFFIKIKRNSRLNQNSTSLACPLISEKAKRHGEITLRWLHLSLKLNKITGKTKKSKEGG